LPDLADKFTGHPIAVTLAAAVPLWIHSLRDRRIAALSRRAAAGLPTANGRDAAHGDLD